LGPLGQRTVAWVGDGNNVAASWIHAAARLGGKLRLGCPPSLSPSPELLRWAKAEKADVQLVASAEAAVAGADCVVTDAWVSMHDKDVASRHNLLKPYQVDARLMALAAKSAIFMHCLPAHRGEEVTDAVIDGPQSAVFDEAENRLHIQKSILLHCLSGTAEEERIRGRSRLPFEIKLLSAAAPSLGPAVDDILQHDYPAAASALLAKPLPDRHARRLACDGKFIRRPRPTARWT
jgi:hypothetical protein